MPLCSFQSPPPSSGLHRPFRAEVVEEEEEAGEGGITPAPPALLLPLLMVLLLLLLLLPRPSASSCADMPSSTKSEK